jgi:hypothetical protein
MSGYLQDEPNDHESVILTHEEYKKLLAVIKRISSERPKWMARCNSQDVALQNKDAEIERLKKTLEMVYNKINNGMQCYDEDEGEGTFIGHAVRLSSEEEDKIIIALAGGEENA